MEVGERIKAKREALGMTQEELARKVGYTSKTTIAKIEINANKLRQSKILEFANALDVTPSYLMGWKDDSVRPESQSLDADNLKEDPILCEVLDVSRDFSEEQKKRLLEYAKMLELYKEV